ncbi:MAG: hypothetical protein R3286_14700 [Gammaproteobacteria bacterium]|nr:hypothetical protein [Gammaproteobacteria bacterium]
MSPSALPATLRAPAAEGGRVGLRRGALLATLAVAGAAMLGWILAMPVLPARWTTPGSPELYLAGVAGGVLTLSPLAFTIAKRCGSSAHPPIWFAAHVVLSSLGLVLLVVHSALHLGRAPALVLGIGVFLVLQGAWARTALPRRIAGVFGTRHGAFVAADAAARRRLEEIIEAKRVLLARLDPRAHEATFSPLPRHWMRHPRLTLRYVALARAEMRVIGQRRSIPAPLAYWRAVHMTLAALFVLGLLIHVVTVTFFAGYVAGGGDIHWWHITAWGGP